MLEIQEYMLRHGVVHARQVMQGKKPFFYIGAEIVTVEAFAQILFEERGYTVFAGTDVHLFFSVLSFNFADSFFLEVCKNYVGSEADSLLASIDIQVHRCLESGKVERKHLDLAESVLSKYYATYKPKLDSTKKLVESLRAAEPVELARLVKMYRDAGYTTKGAPDLFLVKNTELRFIEVKSENDFPSSEQYDYFERFIRCVGPGIMLLRVLPEAPQT